MYCTLGGGTASLTTSSSIFTTQPYCNIKIIYMFKKLAEKKYGTYSSLLEIVSNSWCQFTLLLQYHIGLPPNLQVVPQITKALITTTLNIWRTQCEFLYWWNNCEKIINKCRILLQHVENLKTRMHHLSRKGRDHIDSDPTEDSQWWVILSQIWTAQALYHKVN